MVDRAPLRRRPRTAPSSSSPEKGTGILAVRIRSARSRVLVGIPQADRRRQPLSRSPRGGWRPDPPGRYGRRLGSARCTARLMRSFTNAVPPVGRKWTARHAQREGQLSDESTRAIVYLGISPRSNGLRFVIEGSDSHGPRRTARGDLVRLAWRGLEAEAPPELRPRSISFAGRPSRQSRADRRWAPFY